MTQKNFALTIEHIDDEGNGWVRLPDEMGFVEGEMVDVSITPTGGVCITRSPELINTLKEKC